METKTKYLIHYEWYFAVNYLTALGEQIALWVFRYKTFFWWALAFNVLNHLAMALRVGKLRKELGYE